MNASDLALAFATLLGGGAAGGIGVKLLSRNVDNADAQQRRSAAQKDDVDTLRNIISEVRESETRKAERIDALEKRLDKLEERERHMLTRAAVHESWDRLALQWILQHEGGTEFPHPPPLTDGADLF